MQSWFYAFHCREKLINCFNCFLDCDLLTWSFSLAYWNIQKRVNITCLIIHFLPIIFLKVIFIIFASLIFFIVLDQQPTQIRHQEIIIGLHLQWFLIFRNCLLDKSSFSITNSKLYMNLFQFLLVLFWFRIFEFFILH